MMLSAAAELKRVDALLSAAAVSLNASSVFEYAVPKKISDESVPSGYIGQRKPKKFSWRWRHVVQYSKPLSERLVERFGLVPLSPNDPEVLAHAQSLLAAQIRDSLIKSESFYLDLGGGKQLYVEYAEDSDDIVVVVRSNAGADVTKPTSFDSVEDGLTLLWSLLPDQKKVPYITEATPAL